MRNGVRRPPRGLPRRLPRRPLRPPSVRWWSVLQGFGDVYRNRVAYSAWCIYMASHLGSASTYQHIYLETATWLKNDKVICDLSFVLAFHETWWNAEMLFCQGIGDWQKDIPKVDQKAGYRADEFPVHVVLARRRFRALSGQIGTHSGFQGYWAHRAGLPTTPGSGGEASTQAFMDTQVPHFFDTGLGQPPRPLAWALGGLCVGLPRQRSCPRYHGDTFGGLRR